MKEPVSVKRVAVLGAGTIGGSWVSWYVADAWPAMARLGMTADVSPDAWRGLRHRPGSRGDAR
jgi:hypothetical protein